MTIITEIPDSVIEHAENDSYKVSSQGIQSVSQSKLQENKPKPIKMMDSL